MAMLTLMEVAKRNGTSNIVGLIEEVTTFAPELEELMGITISGTSYKTRIRKQYPNVGFRAANQGTPLGSSKYDNARKECFIIDSQIQVDQAVADAPEEGGADLLLSDEAIGVMRQTLITIGTQVWGGIQAGSKYGFQGLASQVDASLDNNLGGVAANSTSVFGVWNNEQGVHFVFGGNKGLDMKETWREQQVLDGNGLPYTAYVNNLYGWIGLAMNHTKSVGRLSGCDGTTAAKSVSDIALAKLLSQFPVGYKPSKWFMTRPAAYQLQASRSYVSGTNGTLAGLGDRSSTGREITAPWPTESMGIPIVITDSIPADNLLPA